VLTVQVSGLLAYQAATPITTRGDLVVGDATGTAVRLARGTTEQVMAVNASGDLYWRADTGFANPMSAVGDVIVGAASGAATRLPAGTNGHVLTLSAGTPAWAAAPGFANPMTVAGDLIVGTTGGAPARLAVGTNGQHLTIAGGVPIWATFAWPITTPGDLIAGDGSGVAVRLPRGSTGQVLTVQGTGLLAYQAAMPITTRGDLITGDTGGAAIRLARGTTDQLLSVNATGDLLWKTLAVMTNPMTGVGDVIVGAAGGAPARLAIGATNQVLTVVAGTPAWTTPFANPMSAVGDLIRGTTAGAPQRLAIGTAGQVLTVVSGNAAWAAAPAGLTNPMTNIGDLIRGGSGGSPVRLPAVALGQVLISQGVDTAPVWSPGPTVAGINITNMLGGGILYAAAANKATSTSLNLLWDEAASSLKLFGGTVGTSGQKVLALGSSTDPTTSPVDTVQLYARDLDGQAGSHGLCIRDERQGFISVGSLSTSLRLRLAAFGGTQLDIRADVSGGRAWIGTSNNTILSFMLNNTEIMTFDTSLNWYTYMAGLGIRQIVYGGVDSAGAGYRQLRIAN
jgi:hypothetical protein